MKPAQMFLDVATNRWEAPKPVIVLEPEEPPVAPLPAPDRGRCKDTTDTGPWVIVLAGGEGRRLQAFTTLQDGIAVPKQFCHFRDERSLLAVTIDRALRIAPPERVIVVVLEAHRAWWAPDVARLPAGNVLSQRVGRGTAVAILHALVAIQLLDPSPRVVVMPSDHDFEDEATLVRCMRRALRAAEFFPREVMLLGIVPSHLDAEYGLITPGAGMQHDSRPVRSFVEKPTLTVAARLARAGALWNSFIFASTGYALHRAFETALPWMGKAYRQALDAVRDGPEALAAFFGELPESDFSRDVLERNADRLRLLEVPPCGWTDLGTPSRLASWLDRHREAAFWHEHRVPHLS